MPAIDQKLFDSAQLFKAMFWSHQNGLPGYQDPIGRN